MTHDNELDPVARLRAADPASEVEPRAGFADDVVAQATGPVVEPTGNSAPVADLATRRVRRRPRWLPVAAVAASIAIVGALGYGLGATAGGVTNVAGGSTAAPPISLQTEGNREGGSEPAIGPTLDQRMTDSIYPQGFGRNQFSATGLGTGAGSAQAYAFDPRGTSSAERVAALAAAFGIESPVELRDGAWSAGPQDGSAPTLSVSLDGTLSFYFSDPRINPWQCGDGSAGTEGGESPEACVPTGVAPAEDAAAGELRSLLVAAGKDPAAFEFTSHVWEDSPTRTTEARPVVDGQRIDQAWTLEMAENGVVNANGALADVIGLGEYPVVSEQEGFDRLSDPRFGSASTILPIALREPTPATGEWVPPTEPPATPTDGTALAWPVNEVTIVSTRLGLASQWQPDGSVLVVPAYEFTDADGGVWSVIAVADSKLDFRSE